VVVIVAVDEVLAATPLTVSVGAHNRPVIGA